MKRLLAKVIARINGFVLRHYLNSNCTTLEYRKLMVDGWGPFAGCFYLWQKWRGRDGIELINELLCVGSSTYVRFLRASCLSAHDQLALMLNHHLKARIDEHQFLQIHATRYHLASQLAPDSCFFRYLRELVVRAYPGRQGLKVDQLGVKVHLLRSYLDWQVIKYIRQYQWSDQPQQPSDYERLVHYCQDHRLALDYQTAANYHNRYHGEFTYSRNMKVQLMRDSQARRYNDARMLEFIVDIATGRFVSEWNVYCQTVTGTIDADPAHYTNAELREVADTESFNYGIPYGQYHVPVRYRGTHQRLDVQQPVNSAIRQAAKKYWRFSRDYDRGGSYVDLVKSARDVQAWRSISPADRPAVYQQFLSYLRKHHVTNQGIKQYLESNEGA